MDFLSTEQIQGKNLDHLGLIAATIEKLGLIETIDQKLPISSKKGSKVSMGKRVAAMILNGLGFIDNRLYMFPDFLSTKPVERLLGEGMKPEYFNDDTLGRSLDAIYKYGTTKLFTELAFQIGINHNLLGNAVNFDTTTLSVYGDYADEEIEELTTDITGAKNQELVEENNIKKPISITYGYSKDKRFDLKQMVLNLATTGASAFPIWMEAHSGNASDKKVLINAAIKMKKLCDSLKDVPDFLYVGDSAFYENCINYSGYEISTNKPEKLEDRTIYLNVANDDTLNYDVVNPKTQKIKNYSLNKIEVGDDEFFTTIAGLVKNKKSINSNLENKLFSFLSKDGYTRAIDMKWLSRVPSNIKEARQLIQKPEEELEWQEMDKGYKISSSISNYGGVEQRWILVYSEQAFAREIKTLNKNIKKENDKLTKILRKLSKEEFLCKKDAKKAIIKYKNNKYHIVDFSIASKEKKIKKVTEIRYYLNGKVTEDKNKIAIVRREKGRFILATNELDRNKLSTLNILPEYKGQIKTECGFKFIKGNAFAVASVFLKNEERVEALMMIMVLCLMVYNFAQYYLRQALAENEETVPNQLKKPTNKPSMTWVFLLFRGIQFLKIKLNNIVQELIINLNETTKKIIKLFGTKAEHIYGLSDTS